MGYPGAEMMRAMLYEAAQILLVRTTKWSWLRAWAMTIARRRGLKKAIVALARRLDAQRFGNLPLAPVELLAACHPSLALAKGRTIEVAGLAPHLLLILDSGFGFRRAFDAACRLAGLTPKIRMESRSPHTLLALAEAGHGVAIIPSALRTHRYQLGVVGLTYSGKLLREPLSILWDKRRPLPRYATAFCDMWAKHVREVFPITRPSDAKGSGNSKLAAHRRAGERR